VPSDVSREAAARRSPESQAHCEPGAGIDVSRETRARLDEFAALLLRWNARINLIGTAEPAHLWQRHIADALQLVSLVPPGTKRGICLGSGAGFPGLVLALALAIPFDLVESDQRKAAFLREAARISGAPARIWPVRAERATLEPAALITARALAPLPDLLALAAPLLAPGGVCLFPKGANVENELTATRAGWQMRIERFPSRTSAGGIILRLSEIERAGAPG